MADPVCADEAPAKLLLDVTEAARRLGLGRSHVYGYVLRGELRSLKLGRRRKIPVEALRDFITKLEEGADADGAAYPNGGLR